MEAIEVDPCGTGRPRLSFESQFTEYAPGFVFPSAGTSPNLLEKVRSTPRGHRHRVTLDTLRI